MEREWTVTGTAGDDVVSGETNWTAPIRFDGLAGDDGFMGADGDDTCISVETIDGSDCEQVS
jgi:hypothetical protein